MEQQNVEKTGRQKMSEKAPPELHREYLDMDTDEEEFGHQETPEPQDEVPSEPDKPEYTTAELDKLVNHTKELTVLPGLLDSSWNEDCEETIREFFRDPANLILTIFFTENSLRGLLGLPAANEADNGLAYFARDQPWRVYRPNDFADSVIFGSLDARTENALLRFTAGLYAPLAFEYDQWPGIMRDDIFSNINDFLTRAIDVTYKPMGILILYVPWEGTRAKRKKQSLEGEAEGVVRQQYGEEQWLLLNRLEKVARTWVKQIREALMILPILTEELHDVSSEFDFWQSRYENLTCISKQLENERLLILIKQLKSIKSSCITDLKMLRTKVNAALEQTKSNLSCLDIILENCKTFNDPKQIDDCLPRILHVIRFVWSESPYYNKPENIEKLLRSLSVYIIKICINSVNLQLIFDDPKKCRETLETCLSCCNSYSTIYDNIIKNWEANETNLKIKKEIVFNYINAFEQRCRDVSEICDAIIIYGSPNKINLGGTRGNQHEMQYRRVNDYFLQIMREMRDCCDNALDITRAKWFQDMSNFRGDVAELENTIKNLLNDLFEDVRNVEMGIETLYTLQRFKGRRGFQDILYNKWTQVWEIFHEEIKICCLTSAEYEIVMDQVKFLKSENSILPEIYKIYLGRLHKMMINASDWLGDCDTQFEMPSRFLSKK